MREILSDDVTYCIARAVESAVDEKLAQPSELVQAARDALRLIDQYAARDDIQHEVGIVDVPMALRRALDAGEEKQK